MNDDPIDRMGGFDPDAEEPEEPEDEAEPISSSYSRFLDPDEGRVDRDPEEEEFSVEIDPRFEDRLSEFYDLDEYDPRQLFTTAADVGAWNDVRGQHFATQLGALNYMIEGGMMSIAKIFYDPESDSYRVWCDYDTNHSR